MFRCSCLFSFFLFQTLFYTPKQTLYFSNKFHSFHASSLFKRRATHATITNYNHYFASESFVGTFRRTSHAFGCTTAFCSAHLVSQQTDIVERSQSALLYNFAYLKFCFYAKPLLTTILFIQNCFTLCD